MDCLENRVCVNTYGGFQCDCMKGYSGDNCNDINECTLTAFGFPVKVCGAHAICINTPGSYTCECPYSYRMDNSGDCYQNGTRRLFSALNNNYYGKSLKI